MNAFTLRSLALSVSMLCVSVGSATAAPSAGQPNTLTAEETKAGWQLLWDGHTTKGWRSVRGTEFPKTGWRMADGVLTVEAKKEGAGGGGDIVADKQYGAFELCFDFKITPGANSGVKYLVDPGPKGTGTSVGFEYQVLDDERHPDAKLGKNGNRTLGSLYDLLPASKSKKVNPIGEWNSARVVCKGDHIEHWLNGEKILEYTRFTPEFRSVVAGSKFKTHPNFGEYKQGYILIQDHGNEVSYRNLKIRVLDAKS